jgi:hypothetical protein
MLFSMLLTAIIFSPSESSLLHALLSLSADAANTPLSQAVARMHGVYL